MQYEGLQIFIVFALKNIGEIWASVQYVKGTLQMTPMLKIAKFSQQNYINLYDVHITQAFPIPKTLFNF